MDSPKWRCGRIGRTNVFDEPPTLSGDIRERYEYDVYGGCIVHTDAGQDGQWMTGDDTTDTESGVGNPYMFTGRRYDPESGLYYYRARYYSPEIGRFLAPDPTGYEDGMNLYTYTRNNPVNRIDPSGTKWYACALCASLVAAKFGGSAAGCALGCKGAYEGCFGDCMELVFSKCELWEQFKKNPAEWIAVGVCAACGITLVPGLPTGPPEPGFDPGGPGTPMPEPAPAEEEPVIIPIKPPGKKKAA